MFPLRDHNPAGRTPYVTYALIVANVAMFLYCLPLYGDEAAMSAFLDRYALIPARLTGGDGGLTLLTSMFLHAGFLHLLGNMLFLHIFGDNLEDQLGHLGFLGFYLAAGIGADVAQIAMAPDSIVPMIGASGAIAGVMGGYLVMFPRARVDILIFLLVIIRIVTVRAWLLLAIWLAIQLGSGVTQSADEGGVAYWAHTGGFVVGALLILPVFLAKGGPAFWARTHGHPAHPAARYSRIRTWDHPTRPDEVPVVRRRR